MDCEEPRSHAWYHGAIPRQVTLRSHKSESRVPPFKRQVRNLLNQITCHYAAVLRARGLREDCSLKSGLGSSAGAAAERKAPFCMVHIRVFHVCEREIVCSPENQH